MSKDKKPKYGSVYIPEAPKEVKKRSSGGDGSGRIAEIEAAIEEIKNAFIKSNRDNLDSMYNIDTDNLSGSFRRLLQSYRDGIVQTNASIEAWANEMEAGFAAVAEWQNETTESITSIGGTADENSASIASIAQWQKTVEDGTISSIASVNQKADENGADISALASWKSSADSEIDSLTSSVALIKASADENEASISQIVSAVGADGNVTAASIVTAVNQSGSEVMINADKVKIDNLYTKEVKLNTDSGDYTMITSSLSNSNASVHVGVQEDNGWAQYAYFHGSAFTFLPPGSWDEEEQEYFNNKMLTINMMYHPDPSSTKTYLAIAPASDFSYLGTVDYPFGDVWSQYFCFSDGSGIRAKDGRIRYYPDIESSDYEELAFVSDL